MMKKIGKTLFICLLVAMMTFFAFACGKQEQEIPESGGSKVSINDAYDWNEDGTGSTRLDLGGDYEPTLPPTKAVLTIAEGSSVRFTGGATTITLEIGAYLTAKDFDSSTLGGHSVGGVAIMGEGDVISALIDIDEFAPMENLTIIPYWAAEHGEYYAFGSQSLPDYYYDGEGNDLSKNQSYALDTSYALIEGYPGKRIETGATFTQNSYFRAVTVCERELGQSYKYSYRFANFGENEISFVVHQMSTGHAWSNNQTNVASETITLAGGETELVSLEVECDKNDSNTLTLIRLTEETVGLSLGVSMEVENVTPSEPAKITLDLPEGFIVNGYVTDVRTNDKLVLPTAAQITNNTGCPLLYWAYADGTKAVEGTRIQGNITLKPVLGEVTEVTLSLPNGFTVKDYESTQTVGNKLLIPDSEQITNNTSYGNFAGWYDTATGTRVDGNTLVTKNLEIAPYWQTFEDYDYLTIGSGSNYGYNFDEVPGELIQHLLEEESSSASYFGPTNSVASTVIVKGSDGYAAPGISLKDTAPVYAGSAIRFDSKYKVSDNTVAELVYSVENKGSTQIKLSVYQISGSSEYRTEGNYYAYESRYRVKFNLRPGESATEIGQYLLGGNSNVLTYIVFEQDVSSFDIGLAASVKIIEGATDVSEKYKNQPAIDNNIKIAFDSAANKGVTVSDEYLTQRVGHFVVAPAEGQYVIPEGEILRGWQLIVNEVAYNLTDKISGYTNLRMPSSGATLKAILAEDLKVTVQSYDGIEYTCKTDYKSGQTIELPTVTSNTTGKDLVGWFDVETQTEVTATTVIEKDMTIAPYFVEAGKKLLFPCKGSDHGTIPDYYGYYDEGNEYHDYTDQDGKLIETDTIFSTATDFTGNTRSVVISSQTTFKANDAFRFKTAPAIPLEDSEFTINYKFVNLSDSQISFDLYQINSKQLITGNTAVKAGTVTIKGNGSAEISVEITFKNSNLLTMVVFNDTAEGLSLKVEMTQTAN